VVEGEKAAEDFFAGGGTDCVADGEEDEDQVLRSYIDPELAGLTSWLCRDKRGEAGLPINDRAEAYPFPCEKSRLSRL
jgi:hypothetical protein